MLLVISKVGGQEHRRLQEEAASLVQGDVNAVTIEHGGQGGIVQVATDTRISTYFANTVGGAIDRAKKANVLKINFYAALRTMA